MTKKELERLKTVNGGFTKSLLDRPDDICGGVIDDGYAVLIIAKKKAPRKTESLDFRLVRS